MGFRGQQSGMVTLRPSVGERSYDGDLPREIDTKIGSRGTDYWDADTEIRVSRTIKIRKSFLSSRRKLCNPVEFRAPEHRIQDNMDDMVRAIRGARAAC